MLISLSPQFSGLARKTTNQKLSSAVSTTQKAKTTKPTSQSKSKTTANTKGKADTASTTSALDTAKNRLQQQLIRRYGLPKNTPLSTAISRHETQWTGRDELRTTFATHLGQDTTTGWDKLLPQVKARLDQESASRRDDYNQQETTQGRVSSVRGNRVGAIQNGSATLRRLWLADEAVAKLQQAKKLAGLVPKSGKNKATLQQASNDANQAADTAVRALAESIARLHPDFKIKSDALVAEQEARIRKAPVKTVKTLKAELDAASQDVSAQAVAHRTAKNTAAEAKAVVEGRLDRIIPKDIEVLIQTHQLAKQVGIEGPAIETPLEQLKKEEARLKGILDINALGKKLNLKGWKPLAADRFTAEGDTPQMEEKRLTELAKQHKLAAKLRKEGEKDITPLPLTTPTLQIMDELTRVERILEARKLAVALHEKNQQIAELAGQTAPKSQPITIPMTLSSFGVLRILDQLRGSLK